MNKLTCSLTSILAAAALCGLAPARLYSQSVSAAGTDRITVKLDDPARPAMVRAGLVNGGITVKGSQSTEVIVEARVRNQEEEHSTPAGMKRLNIMRTGLTVEEENNEVRISTDSHSRTIDLSISVPAHTSLKINTVNDGDIEVSNVDGDLDVNDVNGGITLKNISGSAVAHALNGRLLATFLRVNAQRPMAFSSLNGDIDVTFPADLKANLSIKSDRGDVFSDFDVQMQAQGPPQTIEDGSGKGGKYRVRIDKTVRGTINGGGQEIQFTNFQGSIYIRKAGGAK